MKKLDYRISFVDDFSGCRSNTQSVYDNTISYPTGASGIIVLLNTIKKYC